MEWKTVTKDQPCPVCGKPDWCGFVETRCHCMRVKSERSCEGGGWIHRLTDSTTTMIPVPKKPRLSDTALHNRFAPLCKHWWARKDREIARLAGTLGVAVYALDELHVGFDGDAWTFPERNAAGLIIGCSRRFVDGSKRMVPGSRRGLVFSDTWLDSPGPVVCIEGASDTAAGITMGLCVVGRPSNSGGAGVLVKLLAAVDPLRAIVVMGENDRKSDGTWPGKAGVFAVGDRLVKAFPDRTILARYPLDGAKDLRQWTNQRLRDPENQEAAYRLGKSFLRRLKVKLWKPNA